MMKAVLWAAVSSTWRLWAEMLKYGPVTVRRPKHGRVTNRKLYMFLADICEQDHVSCVIRVDCSGCYKVEVEDQIDISRDLPQSYKMLVEFLRLDNFLCYNNLLYKESAQHFAGVLSFFKPLSLDDYSHFSALIWIIQTLPRCRNGGQPRVVS